MTETVMVGSELVFMWSLKRYFAFCRHLGKARFEMGDSSSAGNQARSLNQFIRNLGGSSSDLRSRPWLLD